MIIATRILTLRDNNRDVPVPVEISTPERRSDTDWRCHFTIGWPDGKAERWGTGVDAVQSLLFALQMIGVELYASESHKQGRLFWETPGAGYGFPVTRNIRDLLTGDDKKFL